MEGLAAAETESLRGVVRGLFLLRVFLLFEVANKNPVGNSVPISVFQVNILE